MHGCLLCLLLLLSCGSQEGKRYLKMGTGAQTGVYYAAGLAIADAVGADEDVHLVDLAVESTDGSIYNINALMNGDLDFAMAQSDRQYQASHGKGVWAEKPQKALRFICSLHPEMVTLVAAEDSGIRGLSDLKGQRVSIGSPGSGTRGNALDCLSTLGMQADVDFQAEELRASEASVILQDGRIDAFFYTVGHPNGAIAEASSGRRRVRMIPLRGMEELFRRWPYYVPAVIASSHYPRMLNDSNVPTIAVLTTVVTRSDVPDDVVYVITKALFENLEAFKDRHPSFKSLQRREMLQGAFAPIHPGALRYFKEVGLGS